MFVYSHPLINQGAGRIKTDPENEERIRRVISNFKKYSQEKLGGFDTSDFPVTEASLQKSKYLFPLCGFGVGVLGSFAFVHQNSRYIGKVFTFCTTLAGYLLHQRYQKNYNSLLYFYKFPDYPLEIRKMIDNNDARYAHRWLKPDFMDIKL